MVPRRRLADDLDSDSLLHARKAAGAKAASRVAQPSGQAGNQQWIAAVGKEWINVSKDRAGREAIASVVGSAAREAAAAMSTTVADRFSGAWFLAVLLLGVLSAVLLQAALRSVGGLLLTAA